MEVVADMDQDNARRTTQKEANPQTKSDAQKTKINPATTPTETSTQIIWITIFAIAMATTAKRETRAIAT